MSTKTLSRMRDIDMTQVEMILELRQRGFTVNPPEMSNILRGISVYPKAERILNECNKILDERERV